MKRLHVHVGVHDLAQSIHRFRVTVNQYSLERQD